MSDNPAWDAMVRANPKLAEMTDEEIRAAVDKARGPGPFIAHDTVMGLCAVASGAPIETSYTRAQLAKAVDEAHAAIHEAADLYGESPEIERAHEALHKVGAGLPRVACATPDPEAQRMMQDLIALRDRAIPCGHTIADLILCGGEAAGEIGMPPVTKCGACLVARKAARAERGSCPST